VPENRERVRDAERRLFSRYNTHATERFVSVAVNEVPIRLRILEIGSGSPILLLHPASWFAAQWAPLAPYLPGRRLLCLDFPGHGLSDGVDYRKHEPRAHTVALLREVLAALSLDSVPVVGNSLGGMAALWFAVAEPKLVSSVVILGLPGTVLAGTRPDLAITALGVPGINRLLLRLPASAKRSRSLQRRPLGSVAFSRMAEEMFEIHYLASRRAEFALTLSTFMQSTLRWRSPRPRIVLSNAELTAISQPVHFILGEDDIFGGTTIGSHAAKLIPCATLETRRGGHFPQHDDPEACGKSIVGFLSSGLEVAAQQAAAADEPQRASIDL
jgi:pimeloyl-ACP methyl ester carboxylesterase